MSELQETPRRARRARRFILLGLIVGLGFGGSGLLGRATGYPEGQGCGGLPDLTSMDLGSSSEALSQSDCPTGWTLYGASAGGFCCAGSVANDTCSTPSVGSLCALDPARTQSWPLCSCPAGTTHVGTAACCAGAVSADGSTCLAGAEAVCSLNPSDVTFPFCYGCPVGWKRYGGFFCCDGELSPDGNSCVSRPIQACALERTASQGLAICDDTCPPGMTAYGPNKEFCCDGITDGNTCQPAAMAGLVCAHRQSDPMGNPTCGCPAGMTPSSNGTCVAATGGTQATCTLDAAANPGMPLCDCPAGSDRYGGSYCCSGSVEPLSQTCRANPALVCAKDAATSQGNPVCQKCPAGWTRYGPPAYGYCCDGAVENDSVCRGRSICSLNGDPGYADCKPQSCPLGMKPYAGNFCCSGDVVGGNCVAAAPVVCALNEKNTQGNALCSTVPVSLKPAASAVQVTEYSCDPAKPIECPAGKELWGGLCYPSCPSGYVRTASCTCGLKATIRTDCSAYGTSHGAPTYSCSSGDLFTAFPGLPPACYSGSCGSWDRTAVCTCTDPNLSTGFLGIKYRKVETDCDAYGRSKAATATCASGQEAYGGLCYDACPDGYHRTAVCTCAPDGDLVKWTCGGDGDGTLPSKVCLSCDTVFEAVKPLVKGLVPGSLAGASATAPISVAKGAVCMLPNMVETIVYSSANIDMKASYPECGGMPPPVGGFCKTIVDATQGFEKIGQCIQGMSALAQAQGLEFAMAELTDATFEELGRQLMTFLLVSKLKKAMGEAEFKAAVAKWNNPYLSATQSRRRIVDIVVSTLRNTQKVVGSKGVQVSLVTNTAFRASLDSCLAAAESF